jgi:BirA family biotin operon repressor/biotin-[acetyl-CoA-carboxylase] ligase
VHRPLTETDLFPRGALRRLGRHVKLFPEVDSTNAYLLAHAAALEDGTIVAAEFQTAGRGRQGRRWLAPRGSSILLSVLLIEPESSPLVTHIGTLAAVAAAEAVETETHWHVGLRWPNDLVLGGKKLGGILAESTPRPDNQRRRTLVVGIGLNCFQQPGHFGTELAQAATSLEIECAASVDRPALARRLIARLDAYLAEESQQQRACERLREAWAARCDDLGVRVALLEDSRHYTGTVLEVADNGELIVQLDSGRRRRFEPATTTRLW